MMDVDFAVHTLTVSDNRDKSAFLFVMKSSTTNEHAKCPERQFVMSTDGKMEGMIYLLRCLGDKLSQDRSNDSLIVEDRII